MIQYEILLYLIIAVIASIAARILGGKKNGCFYAKGTKFAENTELEPYIKNIHSIETPNWYVLHSIIFFSSLCIFRLYSIDYTLIGYIIDLSSSMLLTMGCSGVASYKYQYYINIGNGLKPEDDPFDGKSEFKWGKIDFWWQRPFKNKDRKYIITSIGIISIVLGILLGLNFIHI